VTDDDVREMKEELQQQLQKLEPTNQVVVGVINPGNPNPYKDDCDV